MKTTNQNEEARPPVAEPLNHLNGARKPPYTAHNPGGDPPPVSPESDPNRQEGQLLISVTIERVAADRVSFTVRPDGFMAGPPWLPKAMMAGIREGLNSAVTRHLDPSGEKESREQPR